MIADRTPASPANKYMLQVNNKTIEKGYVK